MLKNKFFAEGNWSSSEDSSDDEPTLQIQTANADVFRVSHKLSSDKEDDNVKRVVRSKQEKRYEVIQKIQEAIRTRDVNRVYEGFESLIKARRVSSCFPELSQVYLQIDHFVNQCFNDHDWYNKLNRTNTNQLNTLRRYFKEKPIHTEAKDELIVINHSKEDEILIKLDEIQSMRGKRLTNQQSQFESLNTLRQEVEQQNLDVSILIQIVLTQITMSLDYHDQKNEYFQRALDYLEELVILLSGNTESADDDLIALILRMNEEYTKILRKTDPHHDDYIERLKDEVRICSILDRWKTYFKSTPHLCTINLLIIEHMYYKYDTSIDHLCKYIYLNDTLNRARTRASLCQIYHFALHDYYHQARELMLMCHIQETIHSSDIPTQILYNRTMVQLGLCAFRCGKIVEAYQALVGLQSSKRMKELLGQPMALPYHLHLNLPLIECIYLISAMLIGSSSMNKVAKQPILGPPESIREHIVAASEAMKIGDWNSCVKFLINEKMNTKVWKFIPKTSEVIEMLIEKIKEASLRLYLMHTATVFSNISIPNLAEMFESPIKIVYEIISKMIINKELMASIDPSAELLLISEITPPNIQHLSVELTEKISRLHEQNSFFSKLVQ